MDGHSVLLVPRPKPPMPLVITSVKLPLELRHVLEELAAERGATMSDVLRNLLVEAIKVPA